MIARVEDRKAGRKTVRVARRPGCRGRRGASSSRMVSKLVPYHDLNMFDTWRLTVSKWIDR